MKFLLPIVAALLLAIPTAQAALYDRGGGMIYDDVLNITWLQDANYAKTSGYDADGRMGWNEANLWANNLIYGGYDHWRLYSATDLGAPGQQCSVGGTDCGFNVAPESSELAHLFYIDLENVAPYDSLGNDQANYKYGTVKAGPFIHLETFLFWSSTAFINGTSMEGAWIFDTGNGGQFINPYLQNQYLAWAVRDGDVSSVPVPSVLLLMLTGLGLLGFTKRFHKTA